MLTRFVFFVALAAGAISGAAVPPAPVLVRADVGVEVTSAADAAPPEAVCPHAENCTLRAAIEFANGNTEPGTFTITFSNATFPADEPATITVGSVPLPNITRPGVVIDGAGAGVVLTSSSSSLTSVVNGLTVTGNEFALHGMHIHGFSGSCVAVTGESAVIGGALAGQGNVFGGCKSAIAISGRDATIQGNLAGLTPEGGADPVETAIVIAAGGALVGGPPAVPGAVNRIGFADTGVFVGAGAGSAFTGVQVERNVIGKRPGGEPASVTTAVLLSQPSSGTAVVANTIANVQRGIVVAGDAGGVSVVRNRLASNAFENVLGMAIDLGGDGIRNVNDPDDGDAGANGLLNHPVLTRATQARVSGTACPGCQVQVYLAAHEPGGARDYGLTVLPGGTVTASPSGDFVLDGPAAGPGDWLIATATDADGNTSEFGVSTRVGAGSVLCGNVQLHPGWNHVGYFGAEPVALLGSFVPAPAVTAIYRAIDGSNDFERWFSTTTVGRTLTAVVPGESYWFYTTEPANLPGGFSISFPLPVQLKAGWNDLVYLGATAAVPDALASLESFDDLYRYDASAGRWRRFGDASVPAWAQEFGSLEACQVYQLRLDSPATLVPLQP